MVVSGKQNLYKTMNQEILATKWLSSILISLIVKRLSPVVEVVAGVVEAMKDALNHVIIGTLQSLLVVRILDAAGDFEIHHRI